MSPPDASVLARGLKLLTSKWIDSSPDAAFRTSMLRTSLRLDGQPTMESVFAYQKHLQAEIETLVSSQPRSSAPTSRDPPQVRALESNQATSSSPKGKDKSKGQGSGELCRYFMKATGCKRGLKCGYSHDMSSLDRAVRNKKCLACGSEGHRPDKGGTGCKGSREVAGSFFGVNNGYYGCVRHFVFLYFFHSARDSMDVGNIDTGESSPEKTTANLKTLRTARSEAEWNDASEVLVQLAGSYSLVMKITEAGTLLMPYKGEKLKDSERGAQAQTIVPMGQLIQTLGYTMVWSK
ncbi:unnamed protein product, partial [Symbiodinium microadriaticum]